MNKILREGVCPSGTRKMIRDIIESSEWYCNMSNLCWRRHYYRYKYDPTQIRSFVEFRHIHEVDPLDCAPREDLDLLSVSRSDEEPTGEKTIRTDPAEAN